MGHRLEVMHTLETNVEPKKDFSIDDLTPRQRQTVLLIGEGYSYKTAAAQMKNRLPVEWGEEGPPSISHHTVRQYAVEVRDLMGSTLPPLRAVLDLYHSHREELEKAA